jgi:hypothetical protein
MSRFRNEYLGWSGWFRVVVLLALGAVANPGAGIATYEAVYLLTNAVPPAAKSAEEALFDQIFAQATPELTFWPARIAAFGVAGVVSFLWWRFIKKGRVL